MKSLTLVQRLSLAFSIVSLLVFSLIGWLSYQNMQHILDQQLQQQLSARIERMSVFLQHPDSLNLLIQYPKLYQNMVGEADSLLILKDRQQTLININPQQLPLPQLSSAAQIQFVDINTHSLSMRLAYQSFEHRGQYYDLIAGKASHEHRQTLIAYLRQLVLYSVLGIILSSLLGAYLGRQILSSLTQLIADAQRIDLNRLSQVFNAQPSSPELSTLAYTLNQMLIKIENNYLQLARFSADIAHELRTPLNNLMAQTQYALLNQYDAEQYAQLLDRHLDEYQRLNQMINNMLFIARAEQNNTALTYQKLNLKVVLEELVEYFELWAEEKQMSFQLSLAVETVYADLELIQRALSNLISNSLQYGQPQHIIQIHAYQQQQQTVIEVLTPNVQIAEQHLAHLFERFYQVDSTRTQQQGGLGLAIVRAIMQLHGGEAKVQNTQKGVVFSLILPRSSAINA